MIVNQNTDRPYKCPNHPEADACSCGSSPMEPKGEKFARVTTGGVAYWVEVGGVTVNGPFSDMESAHEQADTLNAAAEKWRDEAVREALFVAQVIEKQIVIEETESRVWDEAAKMVERLGCSGFNCSPDQSSYHSSDCPVSIAAGLRSKAASS